MNKFFSLNILVFISFFFFNEVKGTVVVQLQHVSFTVVQHIHFSYWQGLTLKVAIVFT